jgi:hypothetical protein
VRGNPRFQCDHGNYLLSFRDGLFFWAFPFRLDNQNFIGQSQVEIIYVKIKKSLHLCILKSIINQCISNRVIDKLCGVTSRNVPFCNRISYFLKLLGFNLCSRYDLRTPLNINILRFDIIGRYSMFKPLYKRCDKPVTFNRAGRLPQTIRITVQLMR